MVQAQVINYLIKNQDIDFFKVLRDDYFDEYKNEFNFIKNHVENYNKIPDDLTFINEFEDFDILYVNESPKYLLDLLKRDKVARNLVTQYEKIRQFIEADKIEEAVLYSKYAVTKLENTIDVQYINLLDGQSRYDKYIDRCENKEKYFVKTGFKELDDAIGGWDAFEELGVISARPNVGKSQIAIKCATSALEQGLIVGFYSGEMSEEKVGYRLDTMLSNIPNYDLTRGDLKSQVIYKKHIDELLTKYTGQFWCLTPIELGQPATVADLRRFIEDKNLDILFVDQHSLLDDQHFAKDPVQRAANISRDLKNLLVMVKKPIITVSQRNRAGAIDDETDIPDLATLAQSDRIGQDATTVIFLTFKDGILNMYVSKSRDCEKDKKISYATDWNTGTFQYLPDKDSQSDTFEEESFEQDYNSEENYF